MQYTLTEGEYIELKDKANNLDSIKKYIFNSIETREVPVRGANGAIICILTENVFHLNIMRLLEKVEIVTSGIDKLEVNIK